MKTRTYPNIFWILANIAMLLLLCIPFFFLCRMVIIKEDLADQLKPLLVIIPAAFFIGLFARQFANQFCFINIGETDIVIYQPLKLRKVVVKHEKIKGFSISQFFFGRLNISSKSFVIYANNSIFEIIKIYNFNFNPTLEALKKSGITYFGKEPYRTGFFFRKYKY